jgi:tetratricopeptide (TPR) repeat protein
MTVLMGGQDGGAIAQESVSEKKAEGDQLLVEANELHQKGLEELAKGHTTVALELFQQALAIYEKINSQMDVIDTLNSIAEIYLKLNEANSANQVIQKALRIAKQIDINPINNESSLSILAEIYRQSKDYSELARIHQKSWDYITGKKSLHQSFGGIYLAQLGSALLLSGKSLEAEQKLLAGIQILKLKWHENLGDIGKNRSERDFNKAWYLERQIYPAYRVLQKVFITNQKDKSALEVSDYSRNLVLAEALKSQIASNSVNQFNPPDLLTVDRLKEIAKTQNSTFIE